MSEDPYVDRASGVFVNLLDLKDAETLARVETNRSFVRTQQLEHRPLLGSYDLAHLQAFHRHLFSDVYPWAGELRTVNIARSASFGDWRYIRGYLDDTFVALATEDHLGDLDRRSFVGRLAHYLGEVNAAHPFRDGNGRTQRAFFRQLAREAGWNLRWSKVTAEQNITASEASLLGDNGLGKPPRRQRSTRGPPRPSVVHYLTLDPHASNR